MAQPTLFSSLDTLKALADATRLRLIGLVSDQEYSVGELARVLGLKEPTISHHLARLQECDLVTMRTEGTAHYYRLNAAALQRVGKTLAAPVLIATTLETPHDAHEERDERWEKKVLNTYLEDGRLSKIPSKRKKRAVILKWLVTQFTVGKSYPEPEVNALLKKIHPDFATLRRELIMAKLMQRENNIYWRE